MSIVLRAPGGPLVIEPKPFQDPGRKLFDAGGAGRGLLRAREVEQIAFLPAWCQSMESFGEFGVIIESLLKLDRDGKIRNAFHRHFSAGFRQGHCLPDIDLDRRSLRGDLCKRRESDLSCGLNVPGLLNKNAFGILEQRALHEEQGAVLLEAVNQDDLAAFQIVASLTPFEFLMEARSQAQLTEGGKFRAPAPLALVDFGDQWVHSSFRICVNCLTF